MLIAVMFADVVGSTALYEELGDAAARRRISACLKRMTGIAEEYGGVLVKTIGDEILCRFPLADAAVSAACKIQRNRTEGDLAVRIGLHFGPVIFEHNEVYGDTVNVAARMAGIAKAGKIITTATTVENLSPPLARVTRCFDLASVKGKQADIEIHEVLWGEQDITELSSPSITTMQVVTQLQLAYRDQTLRMELGSDTLCLGRQDQCDIVVQRELVSRRHAKIVTRRGKFVLTDESTNGTFLVTETGTETYLRREEIYLYGHGTISLGNKTRNNPDYLIRYELH